jgi:hypothetical protein
MNSHHWEVAHDLCNRFTSAQQPERPINDHKPYPARSQSSSESLNSTQPAHPPVHPQPTQSIRLAIAAPAQQIIATLEQEVAHALPGLSLDGPSNITFQNVFRAVESNQDIQSTVSQIPLKRLTRAEFKSLIDQTKEVMSDKWFIRRKKTPTGKKEF